MSKFGGKRMQEHTFQNMLLVSEWVKNERDAAASRAQIEQQEDGTANGGEELNAANGAKQSKAARKAAKITAKLNLFTIDFRETPYPTTNEIFPKGTISTECAKYVAEAYAKMNKDHVPQGAKILQNTFTTKHLVNHPFLYNAAINGQLTEAMERYYNELITKGTDAQARIEAFSTDTKADTAKAKKERAEYAAKRERLAYLKDLRKSALIPLTYVDDIAELVPTCNYIDVEGPAGRAKAEKAESSMAVNEANDEADEDLEDDDLHLTFRDQPRQKLKRVEAKGKKRNKRYSIKSGYGAKKNRQSFEPKSKMARRSTMA